MEILGIDAGTKKTAFVLMDDKKIIATRLLEASSLENPFNCDRVAVTGTMRKKFLPVFSEAKSISRFLAQREALRFFYSDKGINLLWLGATGYSLLTRQGDQFNFHSNDDCSSGTGLGLEAFCSRFNLALGQACQMVENVETDRQINVRCSVMSKSEQIHLTQDGVPKKIILQAYFQSIGKIIAGFVEKNRIPGRLVIIGGVAKIKPIVDIIGGEVFPENDFFEAIGAARAFSLPALDIFSVNYQPKKMSFHFPLSPFSERVEVCQEKVYGNQEGKKVISFDVGSTCTKMIIMLVETKTVIYQAYCPTAGNPVAAIQKLVKEMPSFEDISALAVTGSGQESVEKVLRAVFPDLVDHIFVENEVIAHMTAACAFDLEKGRDLTYIDIGGQDSKYGYIQDGVLLEQALNQACSAGTGSFLEELAIQMDVDIVNFGKTAMHGSPLDFGEKCTVFFLENAGNALKEGARKEDIFAGAYYSVALNYVRKLMKDKKVGSKIVLQGTPARNLALACALVSVLDRDIIIPPAPGMAGARGAALRAIEALEFGEEFFEVKKILQARIVSSEKFRCQSCDNGCRISKTTVEANQENQMVLSGGLCDKYEGSKHRLPAKAPNVFKRVEGLYSLSFSRSGPTIGIPWILSYIRLIPFFADFFYRLGFNVSIIKPEKDSLEKGSQLCRSSELCVPMKIAHGLDYRADYLFLPKIISLPSSVQNSCCTCPMIQAAPDILEKALGIKPVKPILNFKNNFQDMIDVGLSFDCQYRQVIDALKYAVAIYRHFQANLLKIGKEVLDYASKNNLPVVLVLGRPYLLYESLLNSGIPEEIQKAGALALPADCYPPLDLSLDSMYWAEGQKNILKAINLHHGIYPLWISCFSCGPDSFNEHFFNKAVSGYPHTTLEVDGHKGGVGYKTRVGAFVEVCREGMKRKEKIYCDVSFFQKRKADPRKKKLIIPPMGEGNNELVAAVFRSCGIEAEALPLIEKETFDLGRQFCSGKECIPCTAVIGSVLFYLMNKDQANVFLPTTNGPCRFGMYNVLLKIILEEKGFDSEILSLSTENGYNGLLTKKEKLKMWAAIIVGDVLKRMLHHVRPVERCSGESERLYKEQLKKFVSCLENGGSAVNVWGLPSLIQVAASRFRMIEIDWEKERNILPVAVVGEIYVRSEPYLNNFVIQEMEKRGLRAVLSPVGEWVDYVLLKEGWKDRFFRQLAKSSLFDVCGRQFGWPSDHSVKKIVKAGMKHVGRFPEGEAVLSVGTPLLQYGKKEVAGVVEVAPTGCMPGRITQCQLKDIPVLFLYFEGHNSIEEKLDNFAHQLRPLL